MNHKPCPVCGEHPIINTETSRPPTASCNNIMCAWVGIGIHLEDWDAPRPLEESLRAEIESLRAWQMEHMQDAIKIRNLEHCLAAAENTWMSKKEQLWKALDMLEAARAELEAYKARRCKNCRWFIEYKDGPSCLSKKVMEIIDISPDCCCWAWEPQPAPGGEEGKS